MIQVSSEYGGETVVFEQKAGISWQASVFQLLLYGLEFSTILPDVAAKWLTPLLFVPQVLGSSLDIEIDYHFFCFLTFPPYITAIIDRFLLHPLQSIVHLRSAFFCDFTQLRLVVTDISVQSVCSIFKGQSVRADGTDRLSRNVCNRLPVWLRNIPEERTSHWQCGGSLQWRIIHLFFLILSVL